MHNLIDQIDLSSITYYYKLGEYPDLDTATPDTTAKKIDEIP